MAKPKNLKMKSKVTRQVTKQVGRSKNKPKAKGKVVPRGKVPVHKVVVAKSQPTVADRLRENMLKSRKAQEAVLPPHLIINALAGTGKTTTLVEGARVALGGSPVITPSDEQRAIWNHIALSKGAGLRTMAFAAFNHAIKDELQIRVPPGCKASTIHSMGIRSVSSALGRFEVRGWRTEETVGELYRMHPKMLKATRKGLLPLVTRLVSLCKNTLCEGVNSNGEVDWPTALAALAYQYGIDIDENWSEAVGLVPQVLEAHLDPTQDQCIDYDDMVWLPVVLDLKVWQHDLLFVDEAQDMTRCQQEFVRRAGRRLILCGDVNQAIYGFAGADSRSMPRMEKFLKATPSGCETLPLNETRRCGRAIVEVANKYVPALRAHPSNGEGQVSFMMYPPVMSFSGSLNLVEDKSYLAKVDSGDMVVCRTNAPLVSQCLRILRMGKRATIQGKKDMVKDLADFVRKFDVPETGSERSVPVLIERLQEWERLELAKENVKRHPDEGRMANISDKAGCIMAFAEASKTVDEVLKRIEDLFTDNRDEPGVRLSSIHKAKGLEAKRVFFLDLEGPKRSKPKPAWELEQERNLRYVAITRAKEELVFVR